MYCARRGITNAILLGFGRAIAEVGAVLMVGGNIAGKTRVLTTSVVLETSVGRLDVALQLGLILLVISLVTAFGLQVVQYVRLFERSDLGSEQFNEEFIDSFNVSWDQLTVEKRVERKLLIHVHLNCLVMRSLLSWESRGQGSQPF